MNAKKRRKLEIKKVTVRALDPGELGRAAGGQYTRYTDCSTSTVVNDPLTPDGSHCVCAEPFPQNYSGWWYCG